MADFEQYQSFANQELAQPLLVLLDRHDIAFRADYYRPPFDVKMAFNPTDTRYVVQLRPSDFAAARALEDQASEVLATEIESDYYLLGFRDDELFEVLVKSEDWSRFDVVLAGRLLRERGRDVSPDALRLLRQYRAVEQARPAPRPRGLVLAGYATALLGGLIGIVIGLNLLYHQKQLLDGRQVAAYSETDRAHGFRILLLSFGVIALAFAARLANQ